MTLATNRPGDRALRWARRGGLSLARRLRWLVEPGWAPPTLGPDLPRLAWLLRVPLARADGDPRLEAGKRQNVELAAAAFTGVLVTPTRPLSFWRTLGPPAVARGFVPGLEVRSGCVVPSIGGGLCAVANALFGMAVELGWVIHERHGHSVALFDPRALDATVAWPHVDLRVAPRTGAAVLTLSLVDGDLVVAVHTDHRPPLAVEVRVELAEDVGARRFLQVRRRVYDGAAALEDRLVVDDVKTILPPARAHAGRTCLTCDQVACHDGRRGRALVAAARPRLPVVP
ncbi:MAG: VanW family protein [Kofleriaceae bacterium]